MKREYEAPAIEISLFSVEATIMTSGLPTAPGDTKIAMPVVDDDLDAGVSYDKMYR